MKHALPNRTERILIGMLLYLFAVTLIASWVYVLCTGDV